MQKYLKIVNFVCDKAYKMFIHSLETSEYFNK